MKINPIKTIITKPISFGEGTMNNITPKIGLLSIQNPDNLNFERNLQLAQKSDAVQTNPIKALGCKLTRAYNILFSQRKNDNYIHIPYMA